MRRPVAGLRPVRRLALLLSHDQPCDKAGTMGRLAGALACFFDEVLWAVVSGSGRSARSPSLAGVEPTDGVHRTHWHLPQVPPSGGRLLSRLTAPAVDLCAAWPQADLDRALNEAALVVVQSGPLAALIARLRREAPQADLVYFATTRMDLPEVHPRAKALLERDAVLVDRAVTTVRSLLPELAKFGSRARFVPSGQDLPDSGLPAATGPSAVVLDVRRFDASAVQIAAAMVPATRFHLLGLREAHGLPGNVVPCGALPPEQAARLLDEADLALAPDASDPPDVIAASADLDRLLHRGLPAVCPVGMAGDEPLRFGYEPGRSASIRSALRLALRAKREPQPTALPSWRDVALCVIGRDTAEHAADGEARFEIRHVG